MSPASLFLEAPTVQLSISSFLPSDYHSQYIHLLLQTILHHTLPVFTPVHSFLFSRSCTHLFVSQSLCTHLLSNSLHVVSLFLQKLLIPVSLVRWSSPASKIYSLYQVLFPTHFVCFCLVLLGFFCFVLPSNCSPEYELLAPNLTLLGVSSQSKTPYSVCPSSPTVCRHIPQPLIWGSPYTSFFHSFPSGPGEGPSAQGA